MHSFNNVYFIWLSAPFRHGIPSKAQIDTLNRNSLVSLATDDISAEKIRINIYANPNTSFLAPRNTTVNIINQHVINTLLENDTPVGDVTNALMLPMKIYRNMTVVITENRYIYYPIFFYQTFLSTYLKSHFQYILISFMYFFSLGI